MGLGVGVSDFSDGFVSCALLALCFAIALCLCSIAVAVVDSVELITTIGLPAKLANVRYEDAGLSCAAVVTAERD